MPGTIERRGEIAAPLDFTFGFVADYRNVPRWMFGVSEFQPCGAQTSGAGSIFATSFSNGATSVTVELTAVEWHDGELIALKSKQKPYVSARFAFESASAETTLVRVRIDYPIAPGLTGRLLGRINEMIVAQAIRHVETSLRREVTAAFLASGSDKSL
ncbi:SRPBCC family protein [Nocardia amamiensis]|uniref:SRPBCC family protein n=1 Tax=Nocardia amamiensis TaxID=404578 RepID=UPI000A9383DF|nr:SRPBCC family protein [Nocardia amamiensis]